MVFRGSRNFECGAQSLERGIYYSLFAIQNPLSLFPVFCFLLPAYFQVLDNPRIWDPFQYGLSA